MRREGRWVSAEEAIKAIPRGATIYVAGGSGHPDLLVEKLLEESDRLSPITIVTSIAGELPPYVNPLLKGRVHVKALRAHPQARDAVRAGQVDVVPCNFSDVPGLLKHGPLRPEVALLSLSPPDRDGRFSLGTSVLFHRHAAEVADLVIAEVNERMPRTCGDTVMLAEQVDFLVRCDHPLRRSDSGEPGSLHRAVAEEVVSIIPDNSVVEVGTGRLGTAILEALSVRKGLRLHAGVLGDGLMRLLSSGAVRNEPASVITGSVVGSDALYEFVRENPQIHFYPVSFTHSHEVIRNYPLPFTAVNSALEVDLRGQVNAETVEGLPVSGVGGQIDFAVAALAAGGRSVIALPSTDVSVRRSRIVPYLPDGVVTLPAAFADIVVTEFGMADLRGRTLRERAESLVLLAHPEFRDLLRTGGILCGAATKEEDVR